MTREEEQTVLQVDRLSVEFKTRRGTMTVLNGVSFDLKRGETLGIVGESGSGKSMSALSIMGLLPQPNGRVTGGRIALSGKDLLELSEKAMSAVRGNDISMIFQEPMTSLNPVLTVGEQISETIRVHRGWDRKKADAHAIEMLTAVDIPFPHKRFNDYPHQFSGGMRQRVMIAIALACEPLVLIADEPTTALDVTVQAQIFDLLEKMQNEVGTSIFLITHDMGVVAEMASRVAVMYAGRIVEQGAVTQVLSAPQHPYTQGLVNCVPQIDTDPGSERPFLEEIPGVVPSLMDVGTGCAFAARCSFATSECWDRDPPLHVFEGGHQLLCWHPQGQGQRTAGNG